MKNRPVQNWAQKKRLEFFLPHIHPKDKILEVGCGSGWVKPALLAHGNPNHTGMDLNPPADIIGDINSWKSLGLEPRYFDVIIAFEVVEHVDCFQSCYDLLKPNGKMLVTTPLPKTDWILKITEALHINQKRTSPHDHLVHLLDVTLFQKKDVKIILGLGQWAILQK